MAIAFRQKLLARMLMWRPIWMQPSDNHRTKRVACTVAGWTRNPWTADLHQWVDTTCTDAEQKLAHLLENVCTVKHVQEVKNMIVIFGYQPRNALGTSSSWSIYGNAWGVLRFWQQLDCRGHSLHCYDRAHPYLNIVISHQHHRRFVSARF